MTTGITDVEWLDATVCEQAAEIERLRGAAALKPGDDLGGSLRVIDDRWALLDRRQAAEEMRERICGWIRENCNECLGDGVRYEVDGTELVCPGCTVEIAAIRKLEPKR